MSEKEAALQQLLAGISQPTPAALWIMEPAADRGTMTDERRAQLREKHKAGQLDRIVFQAVVFRAEYPNANCYRFRPEHLPALAESYRGAPFLRDHNVHELDARAGTVLDSWLENDQIIQLIEITNPRDIAAFLENRIDRFSIAWRWSAITCTVCGQDWLHSDCPHMPGKWYGHNGTTPGQTLCELLFENPVAREISAVNDPGVGGTQVTAILSAQKEQSLMSQTTTTDAPAQPAQTPPQRARADADEILSAQRAALQDLQRQAETRADTAADEILEAQRATLLDMRLAAAGLPEELHSLVRDALQPDWKPSDLDSAINSARAAWARLEERRTIYGMAPHISGMATGLDRITEAFTALVEGRRPKDGIPPIGLRQFYIEMTGDWGMKGIFDPDRVNLANVTSSTMSNIVANVLNKYVAGTFQQYPRWWEPFCRHENFSTLQTVRWIILGGVGELPTVSEGAAYTELTWDDKYETSTWLKKGGYLGLTLEAMDMDDVGRLRSATAALAQSAWLTLGKSVSSIFTSASGLGPTLIDTGTLFNATAVTSTGGHANLGTTALSNASWAAAKLAMRKQVEVNSGERLGTLTSPRFLLVPPDLENTALTILASENYPGTANNDINPEAEGDTRDARVAAARRRIVVVDLWTDTNNWAAAADPDLYPTIGIGYRFGRTPEIFSAATPNSGLMFSNDVLPIKARWFYAVGPIDYRGLYKANVA